MGPIWIAVLALVVSIGIVSQRPMDPRTKAFGVFVVFAAAAVALQESFFWIFVYVAFAVLAAIVVAYWGSQGWVRFKEPARPDFLVPWWTIPFFAVGFMAVRVAFTFLDRRVQDE